MTRIYRIVANVSWWLGVISVIWAVILRLALHLADTMNTSSRGWLIAAAALFLCSLATREMECSASSKER